MLLAKVNDMQTILGAGGSIGLEMARILPRYTDRIRLVSRHPKRVTPDNELCPANLLDPDAVRRAVRGSEVAYLVAGLPYKARVWESRWPVIMRNVIDACRAHDSKLVFFDNMYMYDRECLSPMDEDTPVRPTSRKGKVRAGIADLLMSAVRKGDVEGLIARCADFYGPGRQRNSVLTQTVFERLAEGKAARWLLSPDRVHSFTYTPDAARGTASLGNADDAYGQIWHLPTAPGPLTGRQWVEAIAAELGVAPAMREVTHSMLSAMGILVPALREIRELAYQYDRDYEFRSDKFNRRFNFEPTAYAQGIKAVAADYR
jgi:nucleoside-diphosphate-sugar epimerase